MKSELSTTPQFQTPYKLVISEVVKKHKIHEYDKWIHKINADVQNAPGFIGIDVIRPRTYNNLEFVIIVKFESYTDLENWFNSPIRLEWLEKSSQWVEAESHTELPNRNELYFSFPSYYPEIYKPSYWKLVSIGILAVYPLIIIVNFLLGIFLWEMLPSIQLFISVILVSVFLNKPVLPLLTKMFDFWLYPQKASRRTRSSLGNDSTTNVSDAVINPNS